MFILQVGKLALESTGVFQATDDWADGSLYFKYKPVFQSGSMVLNQVGNGAPSA